MTQLTMNALLAASVLVPALSAQATDRSCWVQGPREDLEIRASPFDSTAIKLSGGQAKVYYSGPRKLGRPVFGRLVP